MLKYLFIAILALTMGTSAGAAPVSADCGACNVHAKNARYEAPGQYWKMSTVIQTNAFDDSVIVEDENGELWEFYGVEDWFVGDYCLLTFIDSGIRGYMWDDEIIGAIYRGWNEDYE